MMGLNGLLTLTWKRLSARPIMTLAIIFGLTVSVALMMSVPLYADAVNFRLLEERLANQTERNNRPPFAYLYNYVGAWHDPVEQADVDPVTAYMMNEAGDILGLPTLEAVTHYETGDFRLFPADAPRVTDRQYGIDIFRFSYTSDIESHIKLVSGEWPSVSRGGGSVEVLLRDSIAEELGLTAGTEYLTYDLRSPLGKPLTIPVRLAGTWRAIDAEDSYWLYGPDSYQDRMIVPEETWSGRIAGTLSDEIFLGGWYLVLDGSSVTTAKVERLLAGAAAVDRKIAELLPESGPLQSPAASLEGYRRDARALTFQLLAFNVPTIALAFAFTGLVIGLVVDDRRNETAIMRSRGETVSQILVRFLFEGALIGIVSLVLGSGLAWLFTRAMGQVRSFLDFSAGTELRVLFIPLGWVIGVGTVLLFLFTAVWPMRTAAGFTIVSYRASQARERQKPWWQRSYLDVILLGLALFGTYQLRQQNGFTVGGGIFDNPLLFLLPALVILASILIFLRILPILMEGLSKALTLTDSIGLLQATRNLSRTASFFTTPFILLAVTVSLSIYTASLARTMDFQLFDESWYKIGADLNLFTTQNPFGDEGRFGGFGSVDDSASDAYLFLPISEYENVDGVNDATRIGRYPATVGNGETIVEAEFVGVDYDTFPDIAYWREDFSRYRLSTLMNSLALAEDAILVSESFLANNGLQAGDEVEMVVQLEGGLVRINPIITGSFELFPTWYPAEDGEIVVGRLDRLFEQAGAEFPYRLWMTTDGKLDNENLRVDLLSRQIIGSTWDEPFSRVQTEQTEPARQGLFGLLSIGFVAAVLLTVVGFFLYMFFSFRRRTVELGVLRSVGLPFDRMIRLLGWELALLMGSGLAWGSVMGIVVSFLFIPYLQVGRDPADLVPPYLVEIAWNSVWQIYVLFGLLFIVVLFAVSTLLSRMKLFQAIKLGESV
ncbi:MAG: ABC transporter permease [Anaerolineae bacterium]